MITGEVMANREAILRLKLRGSEGREIEVEAVLDTGFTEYLTLPPALIEELSLSYQSSMPLLLADGSVIRVHVYEAGVLWEDQERRIPVQATESDILLGMSLLYGSRLTLDAVDGGPVSISSLT